MEEKRSKFGGSIGFVLAAAGSAVGLGNIWRFPYLAAKDGGGLFLVIYLALALTFGFALMVTEVSIGRKTKQSPLTAYSKISKEWGFIGVFASIVPFMIMPYYAAIGGWVIKYFVAFATGNGDAAASDGYFGNFISDKTEPVIYMLIFLFACAIIIYLGVGKGIEKSSKIIMPVLVVLVILIAVYSLTLSSTQTLDDGSKVTRNGLEGLKVYVIPDFEGLTLKKFATTLMDALGQLFYSLSVAMGILVAYGSYMPDDADLNKSINQIEIFDTLVAFLAGVMIIPAVYVFLGKEGMAGGPSLMFVTLPKVFMQMGSAGNVVGALFFAMVLFAAVTSGMSVLEAVVSSFMDKTKMSRSKATVIETLLALIIGVVVCFGYNIFKFEVTLPNGAKAQILDILDYISNNIFMPIVAIATCILVGWVVKPKMVYDEATKNGEKFGRKGLYVLMVKYVAPVLLMVLLLMAMGIIKL